MKIVVPSCVFLLLGFSLCITSCSRSNEPDISNIKLNIKIERFDQSMEQLTAGNVAQVAPQLEKKYDWFYADYIQNMLSVGSMADTNYYQNVRTILGNPEYIALAKAVKSTYPNLKKQEAELTDAFKRMKYYFPMQKTPRFISFLSGFSVQTPIGNGYVGIGLDMFLGKDSPFYPALVQSIPQYISRRFTPENITPRVVETYIREELYPEADASVSLLDKMVYNGKVLYLMQKALPNAPDSLLIGYTEAQSAWCKTYETDIWAYFIDEKLIFESDYAKIQKFLTDAPFTPGLGENNQSAPKLGVWVGWQIVKNYMDKHPELEPKDLLALQDAQKILRNSGYKPK
ncbi:MAG: gliding motility lipoprotein GldB [Sphingobacteriales bacterium]|nr:gliding motility lipoprotein GldB [Sphingobacteriales bacterium]